MGGINPGSGYTYEKNLNGVSLDILPARASTPQFKVSAYKSGEDWYLSVAPGWAYYPYHTVSITSTGDRDVLVGDQSVPDLDTFAAFRSQYIGSVQVYKALRYGSTANELALGQQYQVLSGTTVSYVVMVQAIPSGTPPRLMIIDKTNFESCYLFGCDTPASDLGTSAVMVCLSGAELQPTTVTISGNQVLTDATYTAYNSITYWERLGLTCKIIASFDPSTGEVIQRHTGPVYFDQLTETYARAVNFDDLNTPPSLIDGGWSSVFYLSTGANAPSGYTFDYTYPSP